MDPIRQRALALFVDRIVSRSALSEAQRHAILGLPGDVGTVEPGDNLVRAGEVVDRTCLVGDGLLGRFSETREGSRQISALYIPGDMPDLHSYVMPRATWGLTALARTTVVRVPHAAIAVLARRDPAIGEAFWRDCTMDAAMTVEWLLNIGRRNAEMRTAHLLCEMALRYERIGRFDGTRYDLPLTQHQMADVLGLTNVHVNRTLRRLKERGAAHAAYRTIHVTDWDLLTSIGDFHPAYLHFR